MSGRIAVWAGAGFLVAACWAAYAFMTPPESFLTSLQEPLVRAALYVSCPIASLRHYSIKLWWVLLANAATYAAVGLIIETLRQKLSAGLQA